MTSQYTNEKSKELFLKAVKYLPTGIPGHLGPVQSQFIPTSAFPFYAERAKDSYFWDVDGNRYIDYMCAYGPNVLGYNNELVKKAAREQEEKGDCMPLPGKIQVDLAEKLCKTIEIADWSFFLKNGGDATTFALMVARTATNRSKVIRIEGGYHGVAPWTQAEGSAGVTSEDLTHNIVVPWNDADAVERTLAENKGEVAAFISTPYDHRVFHDNQLPAEGYWQKIRALCDKHGVVLIIDDVRCGFRLSMKGSAHYFGFKPDLACYCKALANGYNISAVVGREELRNAASKVFFTGSYWSAAGPMAAALACVNELDRINGPELMLQKGKQLTDGLVKAGKAEGIDLVISGVPSMFYMRIGNDDNLMMQQDFCAECSQRGVFFVSHHNHFINCSLTDEDIEETIKVAREAFKVVAKKYPNRLNK